MPSWIDDQDLVREVQVLRQLVLVLAVLDELDIAPDTEHLGHVHNINLVRWRQAPARSHCLKSWPSA